MWGSLHIPFDDGFEVMQENMEIDPYFQEFHQFCRANKIVFNVISAGLKPVLRSVLKTFLGDEVSFTHPARALMKKTASDEGIVIPY